MHEACLTRRVVFVGGKGGVGKTTVAAALAVAAADRGRSCLVVSTDPAHSLGDTFAQPIGDGVVSLGQNLWGLEVEPEAAVDRHLHDVAAEMKRFVHPRLYDAIEDQLQRARDSPGATEAALLDRMTDLMAEAGPRFDLVVFDTAPTGHTLRLLTLPESMAAWTDGLLRHRERASALSAILGARRSPPASPEGDPSDGAGDEGRHDRLRRLLEQRRERLRRARVTLLDRASTSFLMVLTPDRLSILESARTLEFLERARIPVAGLVVNRVIPGEAQGAFIEALRRREAVHRAHIARQFSGLPRVDLPWWVDDVTGVEALRRVGARLVNGRSV